MALPVLLFAVSLVSYSGVCPSEFFAIGPPSACVYFDGRFSRRCFFSDRKRVKPAQQPWALERRRNMPKKH
jgi:hypothetical protein